MVLRSVDGVPLDSVNVVPLGVGDGVESLTPSDVCLGQSVTLGGTLAQL